MQALSDLAAMGAAPLGALVALCVPGGSGEGALALGVMDGVAEASAASRLPGRRAATSRRPGELVVAVTVLGTVEAAGPPVAALGRPARRRRVRHRARAAAPPPGCVVRAGRRRRRRAARLPAARGPPRARARRRGGAGRTP